MHPEAYGLVAAELTRQPVRGLRVLEIGSYNINGTVRPLCRGAASYLGIDRRPGPGVDLVADATALPPLDGSVDVVICCEVLEHAPDPAAICREAFRVLGPNGRLIVTCATDPRAPHGVDGGPIGEEYYRNVDPGDLAHWLAGFAEVEYTIDQIRGDLYAVARKGD